MYDALPVGRQGPKRRKARVENKRIPHKRERAAKKKELAKCDPTD